MNRDEAKAILRVHRPGHTESNDPDLARALEFARRDPELAQWWERENSFDTTVAEKLAGVPPPADLRGRILSSQSGFGEPAAVRSPRLPWWQSLSALAALVAILASAAVLWFRQTPPPPAQATLASWQTGAIDVLTHLVAGADKLDVESPNSTELRGWLQKVNAPSPASLPSSLAHLDTAGCKTVVLGNQKISIICFHIGPTQLAHLVTVEERSLAKPPPEHRPEYVRRGDWIMASWSDHGQSFMLAMKGSDAELKGLLAPAA